MTPQLRYSPSRALAELKAQHDGLRAMMTRCEELADAFDAGNTGAEQLMREVTRLRLAFDAHNKFEEQLLRPVLMEADAYAGVRIDRMMEDHVHEHREMRSRLHTSQTHELRDAIETLRAHLEAEERYLLTSRVLRDDRIAIETH
ncbi:MAG: hemerythrin domain-containing protein [Kofleriaceae bacterium]